MKNKAIGTNRNEIRYMNENYRNNLLYYKDNKKKLRNHYNTSKILIDTSLSIARQMLHKSISFFIFVLQFRDFVFPISYCEIKEYISI